MEELYHQGAYSVEESNIRQFALVRSTEEAIEELLSRQVVVRDGFDRFVSHCESLGVKFVVVSSGLDLYIGPTLRRLGLNNLEVYSGKARVTPSGIRVSYLDPSGRELTRGFKDSYLRHFKGRGDTIIYVGDGLSDIAPATEADFVVARSHLERHFRNNSLLHYAFRDFDDVGRYLDEIRVNTDG